MLDLQAVILAWVRVVTSLVVCLATPLAAQQPLTSPYREQLASSIRELTSKEIDDLREGLGMGLARSAELNSYPGPRHLLDAVETGQLHLSPEQLDAIRRLFEAMSVEARRLGSTILTEEQALESAFRARTIDTANLHERVAHIAALQGELRAVSPQNTPTDASAFDRTSDPAVQRSARLRRARCGFGSA